MHWGKKKKTFLLLTLIIFIDTDVSGHLNIFFTRGEARKEKASKRDKNSVMPHI